MKATTVLFSLSSLLAVGSALPATADFTTDITTTDALVSRDDAHIPTSEESGDLEARGLLSKLRGKKGGHGHRPNGEVKGIPTKSCNCGGGHARGSTYSPDLIIKNAAAAVGAISSDAMSSVGQGNRYPKRYGYRDENVKLPDTCAKGDDLFEWPILGHGVFGDADNVQNWPDRIIMKKQGNNILYCGLITHLDQPNNGFKSCSC